MVAEPEGGLLNRMKERRVFLFEQIVIFSEPLDKKRGFSMPGYLYKYSIKVQASSSVCFLVSNFVMIDLSIRLFRKTKNIMFVFGIRWAVWGWRIVWTETPVNLHWPPERLMAAKRPLFCIQAILEYDKSGCCRSAKSWRVNAISSTVQQPAILMSIKGF